MLYHITETFNIPEILKNGLIPQLGPRAIAAGETKPSIWLLSSMEDVTNAIEIWYKMESGFTDMTIIQIELPENAESIIRGPGFESVCFSIIPPNCLKII